LFPDLQNHPSTKHSANRLIRAKEEGVGVFGTWAFVVIYCALAFPMFYVLAFADKSLMAVGSPVYSQSLVWSQCWAMRACWRQCWDCGPAWVEAFWP